MGSLSVWHWILIVLLLTIPANGIIANHKGRSVAGWVILGLMFNPIALIVLLSLPSRPEHFQFKASEERHRRP